MTLPNPITSSSVAECIRSIWAGYSSQLAIVPPYFRALSRILPSATWKPISRSTTNRTTIIQSYFDVLDCAYTSATQPLHQPSKITKRAASSLSRTLQTDLAESKSSRICKSPMNASFTSSPCPAPVSGITATGMMRHRRLGLAIYNKMARSWSSRGSL